MYRSVYTVSYNSHLEVHACKNVDSSTLHFCFSVISCPTYLTCHCCYLTTGATLAPQLNTELVSWARAERLREVDVRLISMMMMFSPQVAAITPTPDSCSLWVDIGER